MHKVKQNLSPAKKRSLRVRSRLYGTEQRPRLSVYRSNKNIYLQVINDDKGATLCSSNNIALVKADAKTKGTKTEIAKKVAQDLFEKLKKQKITKLTFDRGSYRYHGRIAAVAEELRKAGIQV